MYDQNACAAAGLLDPNEVAKGVLALLIDDHPGPQTVEELVRKFVGFDGDHRKASVEVGDALSILAAHGLVHRLDRFVFATQAGIYADALSR